MTFQVSREEGLYYRQTLFNNARRVILKVGSAVLTDENGLVPEIIGHIARQISFLQSTGREVILVSSGAVAAGRRRLGVIKTPHEELKVKQALAATGQGLLMQAYEQAFADFRQPVAQILLTHADLSHRERYLNVRNTIHALFDFGVVPIINENDTVSVEELRFSDNDTLGALITNMIGADMYIILTDVDCLYTGHPLKDATARPVYTVAAINEEIERMAGHSTSLLGTGGMMAKIQAAKMVAACGGSSFIGPGRHPQILQALFSGELIGTFFLPGNGRVNRRKHWIAYVLKPQGFLVIDDGARRALVDLGRSLLPSGIVEVRGGFAVGAPVHCLDRDGTVVAAGLSNYAAADIEQIKGKKTGEIAGILGCKDSDEVIHRDNLVIMNRKEQPGSILI
ncbi:glutamate 5-kinase [Desulfobulbus alkaliphilus]|uniref:glutamate 5-kinase n=1 Tax=Desulfobulbus alkaliphilus TaxID=869814 RepID=UPI00196556A7|nr:glutamate 5-kinase [Desulfobulbus alkaliphilus]MBM9538223.1 glutamate 5-kinase [Desulfobulbus alkaliphilus]